MAGDPIPTRGPCQDGPVVPPVPSPAAEGTGADGNIFPPSTYPRANFTSPLVSPVPRPSLPPAPVLSTRHAGVSLRLINQDYTGPLVRLRRASDNAVADIGPGGDGFINKLEVQALDDGSQIFGQFWYDQWGSGYNAAQLLLANQPEFVYVQGLPAFKFDPALQQYFERSTGLFGDYPFSVYAVAQGPTAVVGERNTIWAQGVTNATRMMAMEFVGGAPSRKPATLMSNQFVGVSARFAIAPLVISPVRRHVIRSRWPSQDSVDIQTDSGNYAISPTGAVPFPSSVNFIRIGRVVKNGTQSYWNGYINEVQEFSAVLPAAQDIAVQRSMACAWRTTL